MMQISLDLPPMGTFTLGGMAPSPALFRFASMKPFFRYLLWILIAVLPLQGSAAAMLSCSVKMAAMHPDSQGRECHKPAAQLAAQDETPGSKPALADVHGKCSSCASCCLGASAPPSAQRQTPPQHVVRCADTGKDPSMTAFFPPALERPPRHS